MKRKFFSLILCILLLGTFVITATAATTLVQDYANLMTSSERESLTRQADDFGQSHDMDVVILTVPSLMGKSAQSFADDFYDNNRYSPDGVLFLIDMGSRQWYISTSGSAIDALSDRDLMNIEDRVIPYFSQGRYYEGFSRFMDILPDYLGNSQSGGFNLMLSILAGAGIAGIAILIMRSTMNTKKPQHSAENYMTDGSFHLRTQQDLFLYSNVTKRPRPQNNSSGSTTHRSSSGTRHGGRGGRF